MASLSLGIAALLNTSCKDNKKLSLERHLIDNPAGVYMVDSLKVNVETVRIDTPSTKNQFRLTVGEFVDPFMGKLKVSSFAQLRFSDANATIPTNATLKVDSVIYSFTPSSYLGTNSSKRIAFNVFPLSEAIDSAKKYTRLSSVGFNEAERITSFNFTFNGASTYVNKVPGSNDLLAQAFLSNKGATANQFASSFKGVAFVPRTDSSTSAAVFNCGDGASNFNTSIYYSYVDETTKETLYGIFNFTIRDASLRFTKVETFSAGYPGDIFGEGIGVFETSLTQNKTYLNDILGLRTRISFPGLPAFLASIKGEYNIMEAAILLPLSDPNFSVETNQISPYISLIQCDANGKALRHPDSTYKVLPEETYRVYTSTSASALQQSDLDTIGWPSTNYYNGFQSTYKRFYYPFSVYSSLVGKGKRPNNPFLISLYSYNNYQYADLLRTPIGFSFYDPTNTGVDKIKLLIYLNKVN